MVTVVVSDIDHFGAINIHIFVLQGGDNNQSELVIYSHVTGCQSIRDRYFMVRSVLGSNLQSRH